MIHSTAIVHPGTVIGKEVMIGPYAVVGPGTILGPATQIGSHAVIEYTETGENCRIHPHAIIGGSPQDLKYANEPTKVAIGDRTVIREYVTLNRATKATGRTVIGSDCLLMAYSHVAHDCVVGNHVVIANATSLGGHVEIGDYAVLSSMVAIHQFARIGRLAMVGGGAMVSQDIVPFALAQGDRARVVGLNMVGLKRRPYSADAIRQIKAAFNTLFSSSLLTKDALERLEAFPSAEVREVIQFILASKRGIRRPKRKFRDRLPLARKASY